MKATNLADLYHLPLVDWADVEARLEQGVTATAPGTGGPDRYSCWLATINADGSPHVTGIGAMWVDGEYWIVTAKTSRKGRNLARDPRCSISLTTDEFDLVVEGDAELVTDPATVARIAKVFADDGWPCRVDESGEALTAPFSAPSAGPPPWHVYRVRARAAMAVGVTDGGGATRWQF